MDANVALLAGRFAALGNEARLRIVRLLLAAHPGGMPAGELAAELAILPSTLSHHLEKLRNEGLIAVERQGTVLRYRAESEALKALLDFLYEECCTPVWPGGAKAMRILILCTGNSCRSQMAHGFLAALDPKLEVYSAGTRLAERVNPLAVEAMREAGIDISAHTPHSVEEYLGQPFDFLITVCGDADENCPAFPGRAGRRLHIGFDDPAGQPMSEFRRVRDEIREKFMEFYRSEAIKEEVREKYGAEALRAGSGIGGCCDAITSNLYEDEQKSVLPEKAVLASLGCGNPTALAELRAGEVVLDLGSGGGIDVLLSAKRVGPTGKAYGLDMTDEMLALARENQKIAGVENVEFLKGDIEHIPLPDSSVDVIISNCVINLAADKSRVLGEAYRVLKPGGRFAVSDVVTRGELSPEVRRDMELWVGCIAGALDEKDYLAGLRNAGFEAADIEVTREYKREQLGIDGQIFAGFIRARKPTA